MTDVSRPIAVALLDIDRFKLYNDVHGHIDGDTCIRAVATAIKRVTGDRGHVVRFGGEEIVVLLPDSDRAAAAAYGEKVRAAIEALAIPHRGLAPGQVVTASIGLACGDTSYVTFEKLLTSADTALYAAKDGGRNVVVMAEESEPSHCRYGKEKLIERPNEVF